MTWIMQYIEILGTLASICVLLSFTQGGEKRIRTFNIFGAVLFVVYGLFIQAPSVWILNGILVCVHVYKLYKLHKRSKLLRPTITYGYDNTQFEKITKEVNK